jgi:hypothetical protein
VEQRLATPLAINAGKLIMVTSASGDEIAVAKYTIKDGDEKRVVSTRLDDVIHAIAELGGTYPDVVQMLQEAKMANALSSRLAVDALPEPFRIYDRTAESDDDSDSESHDATAKSEHPSPDLFSTGHMPAKSDASDVSAEADEDDDAKEADAGEDKKPSDEKKGFFARLFGQ